MNRMLVALAATGLAFVGSTAVAAPQTVTREVTVNFADLNLESAAGVEALYARIRSAARRVCGGDERGDLAAYAGMKACREAAVAEAVAGVGNAALTARHGAKQEARFAQVGTGSRS